MHRPIAAKYSRSAGLLPSRCLLRFSFLIVCLPLLAGCQFTQTAFQKAANNAGGEFSAAATTLQYEHEGKLTSLYARAAFVNYTQQLSGVSASLTSASGAPDHTRTQHLLRLIRKAERALGSPCLQTNCGWKAQSRALETASKALIKASGG